MAVDDCAPAAAAGALSGSEVPLAAAGVLSGSALLHSLPLDLLSTSVIAALDSPARAALRATCRQARLIVNGATRAVRLTGMDLAALMAQGPAGFDATLAAAFPRCQALTLVDTPGCSGNEGRVDSDLMERLLGLGPGGAARGLATGGFLANLTSLDVRGCSYLTARGLRLLLRATPSLHCFTATRWCETASLLDLPSLRHLHTLVLGDAAVRTCDHWLPTACRAGLFEAPRGSVRTAQDRALLDGVVHQPRGGPCAETLASLGGDGVVHISHVSGGGVEERPH